MSPFPASPLAQIVQGLLDDGRTLAGQVPLEAQRLNTRFEEVRLLLRAAGYTRQLAFAGYLGRAHALYDPARHSELEIQRWLHAQLSERVLATG